VQQLEQSWAKEFAQPLVDKRRDVDSGNATVAELQIFYLQKDASSWVKNSPSFWMSPTRKQEDRRRAPQIGREGGQLDHLCLFPEHGSGSGSGQLHRLSHRPLHHRNHSLS